MFLYISQAVLAIVASCTVSFYSWMMLNASSCVTKRCPSPTQWLAQAATRLVICWFCDKPGHGLHAWSIFDATHATYLYLSLLNRRAQPADAIASFSLLCPADREHNFGQKCKRWLWVRGALSIGCRLGHACLRQLGWSAGCGGGPLCKDKSRVHFWFVLNLCGAPGVEPSCWLESEMSVCPPRFCSNAILRVFACCLYSPRHHVLPYLLNSAQELCFKSTTSRSHTRRFSHQTEARVWSPRCIPLWLLIGAVAKANRKDFLLWRLKWRAACLHHCFASMPRRVAAGPKCDGKAAAPGLQEHSRSLCPDASGRSMPLPPTFQGHGRRWSSRWRHGCDWRAVRRHPVSTQVSEIILDGVVCFKMIVLK